LTRSDLPLTHYPVIMIPSNKRTSKDWMGLNCGNAAGIKDIYSQLLDSGFTEDELWFYQYTTSGKEMNNIEDLTNGLKWFIYSVAWYTKSSKVQILAHGESGVLAHAAIKKYNLHNIVHSTVYIASPLHGSPNYSYSKAIDGSPVSANLALNSDFLMDITLPDETPFNIAEGEDIGNWAVKYMTIYNGLPYGDKFYSRDPRSPTLFGASNHELNLLDHDGLRCSSESRVLFIPFLSDNAIRYDGIYDKDADGFMAMEYGGCDCDDEDPGIYPGAEEIPEDNIDQDCNNMDLLKTEGKDCLRLIK